MTQRVVIRRGVFLDSATLMLAARDALAQPGVSHAAALAATPLNLGLLAEQGFEVTGAGELTRSDVVLAARAGTDEQLEAAVAAVERALERGATAPAGTDTPPRSLRGAARRASRPSLALVSVPRPHAAYECAAALEAGMHVVCFSDGVSVDAEVALKEDALARGLLMLGPECGTAIVDGVGLGFANVVERGPVGIVGASGTGIQALACLLDAAGVGISHAIGVGGRDLTEAVGGRMTLRALELLSADPGTEAIAIVGKVSDARVAAAVTDAAARTGKPVLLAGAGFGEPIEAVAGRLAETCGARLPPFTGRLRAPPRPGSVTGLFCGGTLCEEAAAIVAAAGGDRAVLRAPGPGGEIPRTGADHVFVDFGDAALSDGRAHPMIDPSLRAAELERQCARRDVAAVLVDVVLGHGAHPDPAGPIVAALARAAHPPAVIASICGTRRDPQGIDGQIAALEAAGVVTTRGNAHAARLALAAAGLEPGS
jgi:FdrA protein